VVRETTVPNPSGDTVAVLRTPYMFGW